MADRVVLLSRENPTLPLAELEALVAVHAPDAQVTLRGDCIAHIESEDPDGVDRGVGRMALAYEWSSLLCTGDLEACIEAAAKVPVAGSIAVRSQRIGSDKRLRRADVERRLGAAFAAAGHPIDLSEPERTFTAWIDGDRITFGERVGTIDRGRFEHRLSKDRAHFSPVTIHPRRGATLVHLARVHPDEGRLYDPFCGTGGLLLEAAMDGYDPLGSDLDPWMVAGTLQALADDGPHPLPGTAFVADIGRVVGLVGSVDGIVSDLPYGRASTTALEAVDSVYERAFEAFATLLPPGGRAVLGCPDAALIEPIEAHGFRIVERHEEYVHRSMTRYYVVAERRGA